MRRPRRADDVLRKECVLGPLVAAEVHVRGGRRRGRDHPLPVGRAVAPVLDLVVVVAGEPLGKIVVVGNREAVFLERKVDGLISNVGHVR